MTDLVEVLGTRRRLAATAAMVAAQRVGDGEARSPAAQLELEQALGDFEHYSSLYETLRPVAADLATYRRGGPHGLLGDLWASRSGDRAATDRILAHGRAGASSSLERRDVGGSSVWAAVPEWIIADAAPLATSTAPLVKMFGKPLPDAARGSVNLVRWATPPVAAAQAALNGSITAPTIADGGVSLPVRTFAVTAKMSIQLAELGAVGVDAQLLPAMVAAVDASIDASVINGDTTGGSVAGILSTASISTASYVDASPTAAEMWPVVEEAIRAVEIGQGGSPIVVVHPRRLSWFRQRAVVENLAAFDFDAPTLPGATTTVLGSISVVCDSNVPTGAGGGTEDVAVVLRSRDVLDLFVGPPRVQFGAVDGAEVFVSCWRYAAFSAGRLPAAVGVVSGSGFAAPTP